MAKHDPRGCLRPTAAVAMRMKDEADREIAADDPDEHLDGTDHAGVFGLRSKRLDDQINNQAQPIGCTHSGHQTEGQPADCLQRLLGDENVQGENHKGCAKKCIEGGQKMVVVTDKDQKVLTVSNPDALKDHIGHHVAVTGEVSGDSIKVDSAKML